MFVVVVDIKGIKIQVVIFLPELNPSLLHYDVLADLFDLKSTRHYLIMMFQPRFYWKLDAMGT